MRTAARKAAALYSEIGLQLLQVIAQTPEP
jgi:hypothetical protein